MIEILKMDKSTITDKDFKPFVSLKTFSSKEMIKMCSLNTVDSI